MRKFLCLLTAAGLLAAAVLPARAEIQLPPDVMNYATVGINGVYSLDFQTANENIQKVFDAYPDHPFGHFGNAMVAWARYEYEFETSDETQRKVFEKILDDSIDGIKRWLSKTRKTPTVIWASELCMVYARCFLCVIAVGLPRIFPGEKPSKIWKNLWR